jgi:hypothetical protein
LEEKAENLAGNRLKLDLLTRQLRGAEANSLPLFISVAIRPGQIVNPSLTLRVPHPRRNGVPTDRSLSVGCSSLFLRLGWESRNLIQPR